MYVATAGELDVALIPPAVNELAFLYPPRGEETPALARRHPRDVRGRLVGIFVVAVALSGRDGIVKRPKRINYPRVRVSQYGPVVDAWERIVVVATTLCGKSIFFSGLV